MSISTTDVIKVAQLARIFLTPEEQRTMGSQLSAILEHIDVLNELDTAHIAPTAQVITLHNVMRPDVETPSLPAQAVLANAPAQQDGCFRVRAVLD